MVLLTAAHGKRVVVVRVAVKRWVQGKKTCVISTSVFAFARVENIWEEAVVPIIYPCVECGGNRNLASPLDYRLVLRQRTVAKKEVGRKQCTVQDVFTRKWSEM